MRHFPEEGPDEHGFCVELLAAPRISTSAPRTNSLRLWLASRLSPGKAKAGQQSVPGLCAARIFPVHRVALIQINMPSRRRIRSASCTRRPGQVHIPSDSRIQWGMQRSPHSARQTASPARMQAVPKPRKELAQGFGPLTITRG